MPDPVRLRLAGRDIDILPVQRWRASGVRALRDGNIDLWAEKCLTPDSYEVWCEIDPTIDQCNELAKAYTRAIKPARKIRIRDILSVLILIGVLVLAAVDGLDRFVQISISALLVLYALGRIVDD